MKTFAALTGLALIGFGAAACTDTETIRPESQVRSDYSTPAAPNAVSPSTQSNIPTTTDQTGTATQPSITSSPSGTVLPPNGSAP